MAPVCWTGDNAMNSNSQKALPQTNRPAQRAGEKGTFSPRPKMPLFLFPLHVTSLLVLKTTAFLH